MPSKRLLNLMDPEEKRESAKERRAEKKNPSLEKKEMSASKAAKVARTGKDMGKPGKNFSKIAQQAGKEYGSKSAGERVAGSIFQKMRKAGKL